MSVPGPSYELRELKKVFAEGTVAVDGISLTVGAGEQIAVIGPSGAGKTTLFRLLNLTLRPTSGSLSIGGVDVAGLSDQALRRQRQRIGTIYQQQNLVGRLRVVHNVLAGNLGRWSRSAFRSNSTRAPMSYRAGSSSAWPWPASWSKIRPSFWRTSPCPRWTR